MSYNQYKGVINKHIVKDDPCWENYEMVGTKVQDGKEVPNCVPKQQKDDEPVSKEMPTKFHLDKIVKHFNAAVYQIEDLMVMYSKANRKDIAKKLRRDADKVKEVYYNLKNLPEQKFRMR